jgi:hypothetical protein
MVFGRCGKFISKFWGYFKLFFIMVEVDNLDVDLEGYFMFFIATGRYFILSAKNGISSKCCLVST